MWGWVCNQACVGPRNGTLSMGWVCLVIAAIALGSTPLLYAGRIEIPEKGSSSRNQHMGGRCSPHGDSAIGIGSAHGGMGNTAAGWATCRQILSTCLTTRAYQSSSPAPYCVEGTISAAQQAACSRGKAPRTTVYPIFVGRGDLIIGQFKPAASPNDGQHSLFARDSRVPARAKTCLCGVFSDSNGRSDCAAVDGEDPVGSPRWVLTLSKVCSMVCITETPQLKALHLDSLTSIENGHY